MAEQSWRRRKCEARRPLCLRHQPVLRMWFFGQMGIGGTGEQVYTVSHGDISAVVSRTPVFIFDPTRENALAHEHVIETVMKKHTIIPMSFGTVFRTDDDIREVLRWIYPSVKDVLKQMEGKVEFGSESHLGTRSRRRGVQERARGDPSLPSRDHAQASAVHVFCPYATGPHDRQGVGGALDGVCARGL